MNGVICPNLPKEKEMGSSILTSACITQALGVTACLVGAFYLLTTEPSLSKKFFVPITIAYGILFLVWFAWSISSHILDKSPTPGVALWCTYICFIFLDTILLGWLVSITGGINGSIFLPIFLLIPAVATCYCNPKKFLFWFAIVMVIGTFIVVSVDSIKTDSLVMGQTQDNSQGSKYPHLPLILTTVFNISCILTAAFCYLLTDSVRKKPNIGDHHPGSCESLYL